MSELSKNFKKKADYQIFIPEYADEEILKILKNRKYYQREASELAVKEAIKRKLISSEQDLFAPEFNQFKLKSSWFPSIEKKENRLKIRRSIARSLLIAGIFPLVWGFININKGYITEGAGLLLGGVLWMYFSAMINRQFNNFFVHGLFVLLGFGILYLGLLLFRMKEPAIMDIFIPLVLVLLTVYGLLFLYRLKN